MELASTLTEEQSRLWRRMQQIELCRHRAETAELKACGARGAVRRELLRAAAHWRRRARDAELEPLDH